MHQTNKSLHRFCNDFCSFLFIYFFIVLGSRNRYVHIRIYIYIHTYMSPPEEEPMMIWRKSFFSKQSFKSFRPKCSISERDLISHCLQQNIKQQLNTVICHSVDDSWYTGKCDIFSFPYLLPVRCPYKPEAAPTAT